MGTTKLLHRVQAHIAADVSPPSVVLPRNAMDFAAGTPRVATRDAVNFAIYSLKISPLVQTLTVFQRLGV